MSNVYPQTEDDDPRVASWKDMYYREREANDRLQKDAAELRGLACDYSRLWKLVNKRLNATEFALEQLSDWFKEPTVSEYAGYPDTTPVSCQIHLGKFRLAVATMKQNRDAEA